MDDCTVNLVNTNNEQKFAYLYHCYKDWFYNFALQLLKNPFLAEDAVQISFLAISRNLHKLEDVTDDKTKRYCFAVVRSKCRSVWRNEQKHTNNMIVSIDEVYEKDSLCTADDPVWQEYLLYEMFRMFKVEVLDLPALERDLFIRHYYKKESCCQIAKDYELTTTNIAVKISRAKYKIIAVIRKKAGLYAQ